MHNVRENEAYVLRWELPITEDSLDTEAHNLWTDWEAALPSMADTKVSFNTTPIVFDVNTTAPHYRHNNNCQKCNWAWYKAITEPALKNPNKQLDSIDYPINNLNWPIMSRRMLDIFLELGLFSYNTISIGVRDKGQINYEQFKVIQLTKHLDILDLTDSSYELDKTYEYAVPLLTNIRLKTTSIRLPPLFRLSTYPWLLLVSAEARNTLEQANIKGIHFHNLTHKRSVIYDLDSMSPAELQEFVEHYNWDDGAEIMYQVIKNPYCDKGTALHIYWYTGPAYYFKYTTRNQIPNDYERFHFDMLKEIERRYQQGFYYYQTVFFDPKNDHDIDWTTQYDLLIADAIPEIMYEPSIQQL